jgi:hypothetical protein
MKSLMDFQADFKTFQLRKTIYIIQKISFISMLQIPHIELSAIEMGFADVFSNVFFSSLFFILN